MQEWLSILGTLNFCARVSPYLNLILPALYKPVPFTSDKEEWKRTSSRLISVNSSHIGRLALAGKIALRNEAIRLGATYDHLYHMYSDASEHAMGCSEGLVARQVVPPWLRNSPIYYKELHAVVELVDRDQISKVVDFSSI